MPEVDGRVLEVGCGLSKDHSKYAEWIGVDRERIVKPTIIADANFLPFQNHTFKLVYSFGLVEHLEDVVHAFMEMNRVGDVVYFSVPRKDGLFDKVHRIFAKLNIKWLFPKENYYSDFPHCRKVRRNLLFSVDLYRVENL